MYNNIKKRNSNVTKSNVKEEKNKLTTISISYNNYLSLKKLGGAGDSFNDVITQILGRFVNHE
jgi:hypothetical protein